MTRPTMRLRLLLAFLALPALAACATVRALTSPHETDCGAGGAGEVEGIFALDFGDRPVGGAEIRTPGLPCGRVVTRRDGTFLLRGVPRGAWLLESQVDGKPAIGIARSDGPYRGGSAVLYTYDEDVLGGCRGEPSCAALMAHDPATSAGLADDERVLEAAARTGLAIVRAQEDDDVICIDVPPAVTAALRTRLRAPLVPTGCWDGNVAGGLVYGPERARAFLVRVETPSVHGDRAVGTIGWTSANLAGAANDCIFERAGDGWVARACFLIGI